MKYFPHILFLLLVAGVASAAPSVIYQRTILPETDSTYELGTSTRAWLRVNSDIFCLTGDSCITSWPSGGGSGTISTSSPLSAGLLVQSTGPSTIANIATSSLGLLTTNVAEGTNLYFTNARSRSAISLTTTGTSGAATYDSGTGVLNIPNYATGGGSGTVSTSTALTAGQIAVATGVDTIGSYASFLFDSTLQKLTVTNASTTNLSIGSLTGFLKGTSGTVSAVSSLVPGDISLTKGNFLVGNDAGIAQATSSIFISSTGNVGIGTTTPASRLQVTADNTSLPTTGVYQQLEITGSTVATPRLSLGVLTSAISSLATGSGIIQSLTNGSSFNNLYLNPQGGNVGIGIGSGFGSADYKLDVRGNGNDTTSASIQVRSLASAGSTAAGAVLNMKTPTSSGLFGAFPDDFSDAAYADRIVFGTNSDASGISLYAGVAGQDIRFFSGSATERMRINSSGNVGIGTTSPVAKLAITGTGTGKAFQVADGNNLPRFTILDNGNVGIGTTTQSTNPQYPLIVDGDLRITNSFDLYGSGNAFLTGLYSAIGETPIAAGTIIGNNIRSATTTSNAVVRFVSGDPGNFIRLQYDKGITFHTNATPTIGAPVSSDLYERMRIALDGNIGIGTTTPGTILSIGSSIDFISLSHTATSTFSKGISATNGLFSGFVQAVTGVFSSILTIPYNTALSLASNGDIGIDSTSNQFQYRSNGATRVLGDGNFYPAFTYATTTAWTGTTTIPLGPAYTGETWNGVKCFTDTGTLNVSFYDGTNRMNMFNASTTVGTVGLVTNNTFTADEKRYVDIGTPATSPTKISCTVSKSLTAN